MSNRKGWSAVSFRERLRIEDKRGAFLVLHAFLFTVVGVSFLQIPLTGTRAVAFWWLPEGIEIRYLGLPWIVAAGIAAIFAFHNARRTSDRIGFQALWVVLALFGGNYTVAWVTGHAPTGWLSAGIYGVYAGVVLLAASWPNPMHIPLPPLPPDIEES